ncbi:hypothetical protein B0H13DRAFT_1871670 [Mycena leptocephala]|nr:hypothetical protein B0H13DRAFT_1871670 [Mycena leptocephala]
MSACPNISLWAAKPEPSLDLFTWLLSEELWWELGPQCGHKHIPVDAVHYVQYLARRARYGAPRALWFEQARRGFTNSALVSPPPAQPSCSRAAAHPQQVTADHGDPARDVDDSEVNPQDTETRIHEAARHFALMQAIFLIDDDVMNTEDANFDFDKEFDFTKSEQQGQLCDILTILPDDVKPKIKQRWVQDSFLDGLHSQRSSMGYRVCTFEIPLLHDKWDGTINVNTLFRGNVVLEGLFEGKCKLPQAKCLERIHKITRTTLGAIVTASILAIWLYSADMQLVKIRRIREGLHDKKAWAIDLLQYWEDKSREHDAAGNEELDNDEDLDNIFGQAPSAAERTIPQITSPPQDNREDDFQSRSSSPSPPPHSRHF